jgi:hypothetical protein
MTICIHNQERAASQLTTIPISRQRLAISDRVLVGVIGIARRRYIVNIVRASHMRKMKSMK